MVCAYVDLNAVRAGMVEDPADYRWCGYGEAVDGSNREALGGDGRKSAGGKPTRGDWEGLCSFRRPQVDAVRPPGG